MTTGDVPVVEISPGEFYKLDVDLRMISSFTLGQFAVGSTSQYDRRPGLIEFFINQQKIGSFDRAAFDLLGTRDGYNLNLRTSTDDEHALRTNNYLTNTFISPLVPSYLYWRLVPGEYYASRFTPQNSSSSIIYGDAYATQAAENPIGTTESEVAAAAATPAAPGVQAPQPPAGSSSGLLLLAFAALAFLGGKKRRN